MLSRLEQKSGWWVETRATILAELPADGQIVRFRLADVEAILDAHYPHRRYGGAKVWYFNATRDREIAEQISDEVYANPNILWDHFLPGDHR